MVFAALFFGCGETARAVQELAFSADGQYLFAALSHNSVRAWGSMDGSHATSLRHIRNLKAAEKIGWELWTAPVEVPEGATAAALDPEGLRLALGREDGGIEIYLVATGQELARFDADSQEWIISVSPADQYLAFKNSKPFVLDGGVLVEYRGGGGDVRIPDGSGITEIGEAAFIGSKISSVIIPAGVRKIGYDAFRNCHNLANVTLPGSLETIGDYAFSGCDRLAEITLPGGITHIAKGTFSRCESLASVTIPGSVSAIGDNAFSACKSLASVAIPGGVTAIGDQAFYACESLTAVAIPGGVSAIGTDVFSACTGLSAIEVAAENPRYASPDGILFDETTMTLLAYPAGREDPLYAIPEGVTAIGPHAFYGCASLTSIAIPDSVTSIGEYAFAECNSLASVTIPGSVDRIDEGVFEGCTGFAALIIPDGVTAIGKRAFFRCTGLTSVTIPDSVDSIDEEAFADCDSLETAWLSGRTSVYYSFPAATSLEYYD
jgi:hypothetical protein